MPVPVENKLVIDDVVIKQRDMIFGSLLISALLRDDLGVPRTFGFHIRDALHNYALNIESLARQESDFDYRAGLPVDTQKFSEHYDMLASVHPTEKELSILGPIFRLAKSGVSSNYPLSVTIPVFGGIAAYNLGQLKNLNKPSLRSEYRAISQAASFHTYKEIRK